MRQKAGPNHHCPCCPVDSEIALFDKFKLIDWDMGMGDQMLRIARLKLPTAYVRVEHHIWTTGNRGLNVTVFARALHLAELAE